VAINHVTSKPSKIVIGYGSAILAAGLFGSVSTLAKPVLSTVNPIVLSSLVYMIAGFAFTPLAQQAGFTKQTKRYYFLILTSAILGATIAPPTHLFWLMEKRYFRYCMHSLSSMRE
jgi:hypothetical protein